MHGQGKAYLPHVHRSMTLCPGPRYSRAERASLIRQPVKNNFCRLIFRQLRLLTQRPHCGPLSRIPRPRRNRYVPISLGLKRSWFYRRDFMARSISRCASRLAADSRLSYSFLPLHRPSSTLTREFLKYRERGISA